MIPLTDTQISPVDIQSRKDIALSPGDTVRVHQKIAERGKIRIQVFEGIIIARKHGTEPGATFTVRRVGSDSVTVEKIFPLYSPMIDRIEITKQTKMRRSRLYFLRDKTPKQIREKLRRTVMMGKSTMSETQSKTEQKPEEAAQEGVKQEESPTEQTTPEKTEVPQDTLKQETSAEETPKQEEAAAEETPTQESAAEEVPTQKPAAEAAEEDGDKKEPTV